MSTTRRAPAIVIRNEDDAWKVLEAALGGEFDDSERPEIRFQGWPRLQIRLEIADSTITPSIMAGFIELQTAIYRTHAILYRDSIDLRPLTRDEREGLEFTVKVEPGSSNFDIDGQQVIEELLRVLASDMDGVHWVITIVSVALIGFGRLAWKDYLEDRAKTRSEEIKSRERRETLENIRYLSGQETERLKTLVRALGESDRLPRVDEAVDEGRRAVLKSIPEHVHAVIGGAEIDGAQARELAKSERKRSKEVTIEGNYSIRRVDTTAPDGFRVRLQNIDDETSLTAGVQDVMISEKQRAVIREAEWAKRPVWARIFAKQRGDQFIDAVIEEVRAVERH